MIRGATNEPFGDPFPQDGRQSEKVKEKEKKLYEHYGVTPGCIVNMIKPIELIEGLNKREKTILELHSAAIKVPWLDNS